MPRFMIEREIAGASELTLEGLDEITRTSDRALASLGVPHTWVHSYVAGDKIDRLHETEDADAIYEHARRSGFPANVVAEVANELGPQTRRASRAGVNHPVRQASATVTGQALTAAGPTMRESNHEPG